MSKAKYILSAALIASVLTTVVGMPAYGQDQMLINNGSQVFNQYCRYCHGEAANPLDMIGTQKLQERYQGAVPAKLEDRTNLTPVFIETIVRNGLGLMAFFRKTEINDEELEALIAYLTRNNPD